MSIRAKVELLADVVVKTYEPGYEYLATREEVFYNTVPFAAPRLIEVDRRHGKLTLERLPTAVELLEVGWRPMAELRELLLRIHDSGVNHRDVHIRNILRHPERGPVLCDWEHATINTTSVSYDLFGPVESGVPHPTGQRGKSMWIGSPAHMSVKKQWRRRS